MPPAADGLPKRPEEDKGAPAPPSKDALKVYVGGLPFRCGKTAVREHFSRCGEIDWLHMPLDPQGRPRGIAFISFWSEESVKSALRLHGTYFDEHLLKVNMAGDKPAKDKLNANAKDKPNGKVKESVREVNLECRDYEHDPKSQQIAPQKQDMGDQSGRSRKSRSAPVECKPDDGSPEHTADKPETSKDRKVFIGGVPFSCTADTLRKDFSACGAIQQLTMPTEADGRSKGVAFATFNTKEGVQEALKFHGTEYGGCTLTVRMACERVEKGKLKGRPRIGGPDNDKEPNPLEVIVKGLRFGTQEDALREWISKCGVIDSVRMPLNKKGKSYGFAFVTFQDAKGVKRALKLTGSEFDRRPCVVEKTGGEQCKDSSEQGTAGAELAGPKKRKPSEPEVGPDETENVPKIRKKRVKDAA